MVSPVQGVVRAGLVEPGLVRGALVTQGACPMCGLDVGRGEWAAYDLESQRLLGHLACWGKALGVQGVDGDVWPCDCVTGSVRTAFFHRPCRTRRSCAVSRAVDAGRLKPLLARQLVSLGGAFDRFGGGS